MQAHVCRRYGRPEAVKLVDVPKPEPKDNEALIKTRATTATTAACMLDRPIESRSELIVVMPNEARDQFARIPARTSPAKTNRPVNAKNARLPAARRTFQP